MDFTPPLIRFCQDCNQERTDTSWSDHFRTRLCMDCYNERCDAIECERVEHEDPRDNYAMSGYELWVEAGKP